MPFEVGKGLGVGSGAVPGFMADVSACWGLSVLLLLVRGRLADEVTGTVIS